MSLTTFVRQHLLKKGGLDEYKEALRRFLSDAVLSDDEKEELAAITAKHGLTEDDLDRIHIALVSNVFEDMSADRRITDEEKESLEELIRHFGLSLKDIDFDQKTFNKFYTLALLEQGLLPEVTATYRELPIVLKQNEVLHYACGAILRTHKALPVEKKRLGLEGSISLQKGIRYHIGSVKTVVAAKETLAPADSGAFYLTNRELGFMGKKKQFGVRYPDLRSFELRPQGLTVFKQERESPYILTLDDYEVPFALVGSLLK